MEKAESREMRITRTFKAPIDLMWEVWTNPEHIVNWWGPNGFTNTIHKMNFQEGGLGSSVKINANGTNSASDIKFS